MKKHIFQPRWLTLIFCLVLHINMWGVVEVNDMLGLQSALEGTDPDITLKGVITISEETVLDLNGKTITGTQAFMFRTKGRQEITFCNGTIHAANSSSKAYAIFLLGPSTVTLKDIELTSTFAPICNNKGTQINLGDNVTIHGDAYDLINLATSTSDPQIVNTGTSSLDKVLTRNKCTIINYGDLSIGTMQDSATNSKINFINHSGATLQLSDAHINKSQTTITNDGEFTLSGGIFTKALSITNNSKLQVTGGVFATPTAFDPISSYIPATHKSIISSIENMPAKRVLSRSEYGEAILNGVEYEYFTAALEVAQTGATINPEISILKDIHDCPSVVVDQSMTWILDTAHVFMASDTDSVVVRSGTFSLQGGTLGALDATIYMDGANALLEMRNMSLQGVHLTQAYSITIGANTTVSDGLYTDTAATTPPVYSCHQIYRDGHCDIRLVDTYIDNLVVNGSGSIALGANCYFPKSLAALRSYVASDCSALLRQDGVYGDVYKVTQGVSAIVFKVGDYEFTNTREDWNLAIATSSPLQPAVLQGDFSLDADLTQSGTLELNGYTLTLTTDTGLVLRDCYLIVQDNSAARTGTLGNHAAAWTIHQTGTGALTILGGRILGQLEGQVLAYGGYFIQDMQAYLPQGYQGFTVADQPQSLRSPVDQAALDAGYPYAVDVEAICITDQALVIRRMLYAGNVVIRSADTTVVVDVLPLPTPYTIALDHLPQGRYMVEFDQGEVIYVINLHPTVEYIHDTTHVYASMFDDEQFLFNGSVYTSQGNYTQVLTNQAGADSVVVLHLQVRSCDIPITYIQDSLCYVDAVVKYPQFEITGSGVYVETLLSRVSPCDSVVEYAIHIWDKPVLPNLATYDEKLLKVVCGWPLNADSLLAIVRRDARPLSRDTAEFTDLWVEVKVDSLSPFVRVRDQKVPVGIDSLQLRLVGQTACADTILYGTVVDRLVESPSPENTPELGGMPAESKFGSWLLMIQHKEIVDKGYEFDKEDVIWFKVQGEVDPVEAIVDDIEVGRGYYYTADQSLSGNYYAIILDHSTDCGAVLRTVVVSRQAAQSIRLFPRTVRSGENMTLGSLLPEATTYIAIYDLNGQLVQSLSIEGKESYQISAHQPSGLYLMHVENGAQATTFKYMITQ